MSYEWNDDIFHIENTLCFLKVWLVLENSEITPISNFLTYDMLLVSHIYINQTHQIRKYFPAVDV